jgi:hypothetical protein
MIRLPAGFDLNLFVSEIMIFGIALVGVALVFVTFKIINKALNYIRS